MTPEQFTYWLQGFVEVTGNPAMTSDRPTDEQWKIIKDHLQTVFHKVTPTYIPPTYTPPDGGSGRTSPTYPFDPPYKVIC